MKKRLRIGLLVAVALGGMLQLSGYRLLYSAFAFDEYRPPGTEPNPVVLRHLYSCHYFSGLGLYNAVVPLDRRGWCNWVCRPTANSAWRPIFDPRHAIARQPTCRDEPGSMTSR